MKKLIASTVLAVPVLASAKPPVPAESHAAYVAQVRHIIERNETRYGKAMKEGDAAAYASLFTEDATVLRGNAIIKGRNKLKASFQGGKPFRDVVFSVREVDVSGNFAYEVGTYKVTTAAGKINTGSYLEVWKHLPDGTWRIQVESTVPHQ